MKNIIAYKESKATLGSLLMILIILTLIGVDIYRLCNIHKYKLMVQVVLIALLIVGIFYLIITIKDLIKNIIIPKELIYQEDDYLVFYENKKYLKLHIKDIKEVSKGTLLRTNILFYQASIVISTTDTRYVVKQVKNLNETYNTLLRIINQS